MVQDTSSFENPSSRVDRRCGFTLVELLVVIGIIALLISILLPALGKARAQASSVYCQSNLHSMGLALFMYCGDNKGQVPWGNGWTYRPDGKGTDWARECSHYMGTKLSNVTPSVDAKWLYSKVMTCPDGIDGTNPSTDKLQYGANLRVFSDVGLGTNDATGNWTPSYSFATTPAKLSAIPYINQTAIIWDQQCNPATGATPSVCWALDNSAFSNQYQNYMSLYVGSTNYQSGAGQTYPFSVSSAMGKQYNTDAVIVNYDISDPHSQAGFRYRHLFNTSLNMLFGDGHVEPRRMGQILRKDFYPLVHLPGASL